MLDLDPSIPQFGSIAPKDYCAAVSSTDALRALMERHGDDLPLDRSLLALATEEYPELDELAYRRVLDRWARQVEQSMLAGNDGPEALHEILFDDVGLKGNRTAYYDPDNSLLNQVLDRRLGIPITLSAVYIEVGRRVGETVYGVGFPGHFLVGHEWHGQELLIDPFHGGERLTREDCAERLKAMSDGEVQLADWMLARSTGRSLVARVLTNLKVAYAKAGNVIQAVRAIDRLVVVVPERHEELRDRGLLYAELGLARAAISDLEKYLAAVPNAEDRDAVQKRLPLLWTAARRMN